jgi:glycosyltransferase involved in cell wall biosynthesis
MVSIGVPIYNEERYLSAALDSLVGQDYPNLEIIIVDNASTDNTGEICAEYVARDKRIRYHREQTNTGSAANFHRAFALSSGKYFTWASGHDMRDTTAVSRCVEVLEKKPGIVLCYPKTLFMPYGGDSFRNMDGDTLETSGLTPARRMKLIVQRLGLGNAIYGVIRASTLARVRLPQAILWSDLAFLAELSLHGGFHQVDDRLFLRKGNRPPDRSIRESAERQYVLMDPVNEHSLPRYPDIEKLRELQKVVWRAPYGLAFKISMTIRVVWWVLPRAAARQLLRPFPGLMRRLQRARRARWTTS